MTNRTVRDSESGRLVDYAVTHEVMEQDGTWHAVARIDCSHGEVHRHVPPADSNGELKREVIRVIRGQGDAENTYQYSLSEIYDNLEIHESRWRNGY
ncbi:hypothetical protein ATJ78_1592 [Paramicrobacterium agarici]|uniref:DUF7718 domain-containing protein n=1 Tax=Paramicrobacterium agarici TaxID=630514 RepID=A0A2A9DV48_9MICO|nr:hypothetical protein [Microbacterium agarici]PFG30657.1 hypothetical protein ATJ78_1592 [Microbacterium agarici]